jgi:hypothetical protein
METFIALLQHDNGKVSIRVRATDKETAKRAVMSLEGCPESAILSIKNLNELN